MIFQLGGFDKRSLSDHDRLKPAASDALAKKAAIDGDIFAKDWRDYNCKTWHLEPTVRLLSVAGKYIEPYGKLLENIGRGSALVPEPPFKCMISFFSIPVYKTLL